MSEKALYIDKGLNTSSFYDHDIEESNITNTMDGTAYVEKIKPIKLNIYTDNDTYVYEKNPFFNYSKKTTLKNGVLEDKCYSTYISFPTLKDIQKDISKNILNGYLELTPINEFSGTIKVYTTEQEFDASSVTWYSKPEKKQYLGEITVDNVITSPIRINLGNYVRDVSQRKIVHTGLCLETKAFLNVYSSDTQLDSAKPKIVVEYYDPKYTTGNKILDSEINIKPVSVLDSEILMKLPFPILDSEIVFSKDSINQELILLNSSILPSELSYKFVDEEPLMSEVILSQNKLTTELRLGKTTELDSELILKSKGNTFSIDTDITITPVNAIKSELNLAFKSDLDSEIILKNTSVSQLNTEILLSQNALRNEIEIKQSSALESSINLALPGKDELDSEIIVKLINQEKDLPTEINFRIKEELDSEIIINPVEVLPSEIAVKIVDKEEVLDSEMVLELVSARMIPTEITILPAKVLDSEIIVKMNGKQELPSELLLTFTEETLLASEIKLGLASSLDSEVLWKFPVVQTVLDSELTLKINKDIPLPTELDLIFAKSLDSEIKWEFPHGYLSLPTKLTLKFIDQQEILPSEIIIDKNPMKVYFYTI